MESAEGLGAPCWKGYILIMKKLKYIQNEKGVALMMVLLIATITLAVTTTMLYMLTQSTRYSGLQKRMSTATEASTAGLGVIMDYISAKGSYNVMGQYTAALDFNNVLTTECESDKLNQMTPLWRGCNSSIFIDPNNATSYDNSFVLGNYKVFSKIVYTVKGNTAGSGSSTADKPRFRNICVVHCGGGDFAGQAIPATYIIEIDARNMRNLDESSKMSILFQY